MTYQLVSRPEGETSEYAAEELWRCLSAMDDTLAVGEGGLSLSLALLAGDPESDRIEIDVREGVGRIAGVSPRAVLIAVYRFLYELGCRFTCPDEAGEHIPKRALAPAAINVSVAETPSYRYRGVCMEGAISEKNVMDMIAFLPKVGMNTYFIQFFRPTNFFRSWREDPANPEYEKGPYTPKELDEIHDRIVREMKRRGLDHQAIGHGWTCEPYGVAGDGWRAVDADSLPADFMDAIAVLDGEKKLYAGSPLMTNLCYGRKDVRRRLVTAVADYCAGHPGVSAVHFWLSDGHANFCECERCRDIRPSDQYVDLLNEIDEELTARGITTKLVFLAYFDLIFAPLRARLKNPDRFILMLAPNSRTYEESYADGIEEAKTLPSIPFLRNRWLWRSEDKTASRMPYGTAEVLSCLRDWREVFAGDGFLFDYYLIWDHVKDPGYMGVCRVIWRDMKALGDIGLNGTVNCQYTRCAFPVGLPMYMMARTLWCRDADYDEVANEYFTAEFGEKGPAVRAYLEELTRRFHLSYLRNERRRLAPELAADFDSVPGLIGEFRAAHPELRADSEVMAWRTLAIHADFVTLSSMMFARRARGIPHEDIIETLKAYVTRTELSIQSRFDGRGLVKELESRFARR
ncbi:MAG: DUF4838 domain-containing protein [Clostridia bacterium]|nr:DUF4838 domain-containing protein [Clostridia bacterium]